MSTLCQLVVMEYVTGERVEGYAQRDLENAAMYAEWAIEQGQMVAPRHGFSWRKFAAWCRRHSPHNSTERSEK